MNNKQKKGVFWGLLKVVVLFVIIFVVLSGGNFVIRQFKKYREKKGLSGGFDIATEKEYKETWKNTMSDIEGMTVWDKYKNGLAVSRNSDTDGDGLTDKDEIEKYKSDPLKISTAGDLYTDSYKVAHNMDVNKRCEYEGDILFPNNECTEISLCAEIPTDLNAVVKRKSFESKVKGCEVYAAYEIYNYSGKVTINLNRIPDQDDINAKSVTVYVYDGDELEKYTHTADKRKITLKKKLNPEYQYVLYVCEKSKVSMIGNVFGHTAEFSGNFNEEEVTGAALVRDAPLLTYLCDDSVDVYYEDLGDDEKNEVLLNKINAETNEIVEYEPKHYSKDHIKKTSAFEIKAQYEFLHEIVPFFDVTYKDDASLINLLYFYYSYEDRNAYLAGKDVKEEEVTGFAVNELPFPNFKSYIGKTGNCAGITHLTAYVYNNKRYPDSGTYTQDGYDISWNLSGDEENDTLMNAGLYDYKTKSFVEDNASYDKFLDINKLTDGEAEFVKMIGSAYLFGNKKANGLYQYTYGGINGNHIYDYALVEEMMNFLDSGKILDVYFAMNDGTGHTVNVYGYEKDASDPDVVWFNVYDPNFPRDNTGKQAISDTGFKLKVTKRVKALGDGDTFSYDYSPLRDDFYGATSNRKMNKMPMMLVLDENWNDINPVMLQQDITAGFTLAEDNNSFLHSTSSFFTSEEEQTYHIDDEYYYRLIQNSSDDEKKLIQKKEKAKWSGSCYGVAGTMGLLYDGEIGISDLTDSEDVLDYYDIGNPVDDHKLRNMINFYQLSQYLSAADKSIAVSNTYNKSDIYRGLINFDRSGDELSVFLEKLINHTKQSIALLDYAYAHSLEEVIAGADFVGNHAIMALECKETEDGYIIVLYDENRRESKSEMTVSKDLQSFSFTDGNGNVINEENFVSLYFKDFETIYTAVNRGKSLKDRDTTIVFSSDSDFTIRAENGEEMSFSSEGFNGDLFVDSIDFISRGEEGYPADIVIKTDDSSSFSIDSRGENLDIIVSSDEHFYSVSGKNIKSAVMHDGVVDVDGEQYDFEVAISSDTDESATDLVSYSGAASGKIKVETEGEKVVISGDKDISNLVAYNYEKDKTYDGLKPGKDGEHSVSAGTTKFILKKNWRYDIIAIVVLAVVVISFMKKLKKR